MTEPQAENVGTPPEGQCLRDDVHPGHQWTSLTHRWFCPGRAITRTQRLAGYRDPLIDLPLPSVFDHIATERQRAHEKHGENSMESAPWDDPTGRRYRILVEEVGEVAQEFNDAEIEGRQVDWRTLRVELIQVAAMAAAWADACTLADLSLRPAQEVCDA